MRGLFVLAGSAISALSRRRLGDGHGRVGDRRRRGALIMRQAVTQEIDVVTLLEAVQTLVSAAGFSAGQARMRHRLGHFELEAEFDGVTQSVFQARDLSSSVMPA